MLNGAGAGHRIDHDSNCAKYLSNVFEGLDHFCIGNLLIASSRDYDLLFCFVLPRYLACIPWSFLGNKVGETLEVLVCNVFSFFMHFYLALGHAICLIFVLSYKP